MEIALLQHEVTNFGLQLKLMLFDMILFLLDQYSRSVGDIQTALAANPSPDMTVALMKAYVHVTQIYGELIRDVMQRL